MYALHLTRPNSETIILGHFNKQIKILQFENRKGRGHLKD